MSSIITAWSCHYTTRTTETTTIEAENDYNSYKTITTTVLSTTTSFTTTIIASRTSIACSPTHSTLPQPHYRSHIGHSYILSHDQMFFQLVIIVDSDNDTTEHTVYNFTLILNDATTSSIASNLISYQLETSRSSNIYPAIPLPIWPIWRTWMKVER